MQNDHSHALAAVDFFRDKRILCIGDVMLDRYVYGDVDRISPEAPIPVFTMRREEAMLGAAGNVAKNIAALGGNVDFYCMVGDDKAGLEVKRLVGSERNIIPFVTTSSAISTTVKTRYLSGNQQMMRVDVDTKSNAIPLPDNINEYDAVIISDYNKGVCEEIDVRNIKVPCVVDTKSWLGEYVGAQVITPNLGELAASVDWFNQNGSDEKVYDAARYIIAQHKIKNVLVTRASKGMTLLTDNNELHHIPAVAKEVYDVVGAGDTVAAVLALGLACKLPMHEAAFIANVAGGIVVGKRGTATCTPMELKANILGFIEIATLESI